MSGTIFNHNDGSLSYFLACVGLTNAIYQGIWSKRDNEGFPSRSRASPEPLSAETSKIQLEKIHRETTYWNAPHKFRDSPTRAPGLEVVACPRPLSARRVIDNCLKHGNGKIRGEQCLVCQKVKKRQLVLAKHFLNCSIWPDSSELNFPWWYKYPNVTHYP